MKISLAKKIVYGLTIGSFFLSFGGLALAHDASHDAVHRPGRPPEENMPDPGDMAKHISNTLDNLVLKGIISKDQSDKIIDFAKEKEIHKKAEIEKMKEMNPEDCETYRKQHFHKHHNFIAELKTAANLSEEQAKALADAIHPPREPKMPPHLK